MSTKVKEEILTLEEYLLRVEVNEGLVASFKVEASEEDLKSKTPTEWDKAFEAQSNRVYE